MVVEVSVETDRQASSSSMAENDVGNGKEQWLVGAARVVWWAGIKLKCSKEWSGH